MSHPHKQAVVFGIAAGVVIGAALLGLLLLGVSGVHVWWAETGPGWSAHPLFGAGWQLIGSSLMVAAPLALLGGFWRQR